MTQIKKQFDNVMDGIDNMLNAAAYDYSLGGYTHRFFHVVSLFRWLKIKRPSPAYTETPF
jgi:hypothetical protein